MARGKFITFEGGEGCGKSTQVKRLKEALEKTGVEVLLTREPGGTWLSEEIRHLIKDQTTDAPCDRSELLLFLAARAQLVKNVIRPALEAGKWVVSDRLDDRLSGVRTGTPARHPEGHEQLRLRGAETGPHAPLGRDAGDVPCADASARRGDEHDERPNRTRRRRVSPAASSWICRVGEGLPGTDCHH